MMTDNLLEFLNEIQKFAVRIKIQETINSLIKDDRVHNIINSDVVLEYYEKMHEHFDKIPEDFLFPNREWLDESLKRLNIDLSDIFDESANPDQIKREEIIILFLTLWVNMKIQDPVSCENIEEPYELFNIWVKDRVLIIRPTKEKYLHHGDNSVLNHVYKNYGWYTRLLHTFNIDEKGEVKYHYNSPDGITKINKMYNKRHDNEIISNIAYNIKDIEDTISKLNDYALEEKEHHNIIVPRNTKFVVREMSGLSNKEYKQLLKYYNTNELKKACDPYIKEVVDVLAEDYGIEVDSDFISYTKRHAKPKENSPFQTIAIIDIINAMIKLKDKINE
nr:MAG TPA: hypothetical protein [Caudoviricetes sp.]